MWNLCLAVFMLNYIKLLAAQTQEIVFLAIHSYTSLPYSLDYVGPGMDLAVSTVNALYYPLLNVSLVALNDTKVRTCDDLQGQLLSYWMNYYYSEFGRNQETPYRTLVVVASCSDSLIVAGDLAREMNIPVLSASGSDERLDSRERFPTLLRLVPYRQTELSGIVASLLDYFKWLHVTIFCDEAAIEINTFSLICKSLPPFLLSLQRMRSVTFLRYNFITSRHEKFLLEASRTSRVFIVITHASRLRTLLVAAQHVGFTNGEYAFIAYWLYKAPAFGNMNWRYGDQDDLIVKQASAYLLLITIIQPDQPNYFAFFERMKNDSENFYGNKYDADEEVSPFVTSYYNAIFAMSQVVIERDVTDPGVNLAKRAWNRTFLTPIGSFYLDDNGDLASMEYGIKRPVLDSEEFEVVLVWDKITELLQPIGNRTVAWPNNRSAPVDTPACGFTGEDIFCRTGAAFTKYAAGISGAMIATIAMIICLVVRFYSHQQLKNKHCIIPKENLKLPHDMKIPLNVSGPMLYREGLVWVRRPAEIGSTERLASAILAAVKLRTSLHHDNVASFLGIVEEHEHLCGVCEFFPKGSLSTFLIQKRHSVDHSLQRLILDDIVKGLHYIHSSPVKLHGSFKTSNCMLTTQFSIKITDFGLPFLRRKPFQNLLRDGVQWIAPEQLLHPTLPVTRAGDLYAFGMVMYHVLFLESPFAQSIEFSALNTLTMLASSWPEELITLLRRTLEHDALQRPTIQEAKETFHQVSEGKKQRSYMDIVFRRLAAYAADLEQQVASKTDSLMVEKQKSDELLRNILPQVVANSLISGQPVVPEIFSSTSIAFTGVWEFSELVSGSLPLTLMNILNELFSCLDALLWNFDVYKVETIKDSYMLASGVPARNGDAHAAQIAGFCCAIREKVEVETFVGTTIKLYLGIHTGYFKLYSEPFPVFKIKVLGNLAAGIVGQRMMRYCLFGDTVNVASRMASSSSAQMIQISSVTKGILEGNANNAFRFTSRGEILVKGKGMMEVFWLHKNL